MPEIGVDRLLYLAPPGDQRRPEPGQIVAPRLEGGGSVAEMGGALSFEDVVEALRVGGLCGDVGDGRDRVPWLLVRELWVRESWVRATGCCGRWRRAIQPVNRTIERRGPLMEFTLRMTLH